MTTPTLQLEDLLDLREELCRAGFDPGLQRTIAAHNLLLALAAHGRLPADPRAWRTWLAPVFCAASQEQEEFYRCYEAWVQRRPALAEQAAAQPQPAQAEAAHETKASAQRPWFRRPLVWATMATAVVLLAVLAWFWLQRQTTQQVTGQVFSENETQPLAGAKAEFARQTVETDEQGRFAFDYQISNFERLRRQRSETLAVSHDEHFQRSSDIALPQPAAQKIVLVKRRALDPGGVAATPRPTPTPQFIPQPADTRLKLWQIALIVAPLVLYALWLVWRWLRRRALLQKLPADGMPQLQYLEVAGSESKLFASPQVRRLLLGLRRPRPMPVRDLDVRATVRATVRQGGLFTPAYGARRSSPEYLLLIDRASAHDEQASVADELRRRLDENGVFVEPYYFQGDARACRSIVRDEAAVTLQQLAARYPDHRLLVFGDGVGFFEPFTGRPQRWLEQFAPWEQRVLLTPEAPARWGYRERVLAAHDFLLLPVSAEGLEDLGEWLSYGLAPAPEKRGAARFPEMIAERPLRWLERHAPLPDEVEELEQQVRAYLGPEGWDWLCACAVYPQVTWELTLCHGYWLFGGDDEWRENWAGRVLRLVRLPWFRYGTMPDWWRECLLDTLQGEKEVTVRRGIERLLTSALEHPDEPVKLEYAEPVRLNWRERWRAWRRRRRNFRGLQTSEPEEALRDYVFLRFLAGQRPARLGVRVPEMLRRLLFKDGQAVLGWHPVTLGMLALLLSAGLLWWFLRPVVNAPLPEAPVAPPLALPTRANAPLNEPAPTPTATPAPTPRSSPSPAPGETLAGRVQLTPDPNARFAVRESKDGYAVELGNNITLDLVALPGGEFMMGSDKIGNEEKPVHRMRVAPFAMGKYEVTQAQWLAVMGGENPSYFKGTRLPVESVSWNDAVEFCNRLSQMTGQNFRLPTEAEWEYAARAGTTTEYSFGDDAEQLGLYAWYDDNSGNKTQPVGGKRPNPFGLCDMHGNVWEWCQDVWHDSYGGQHGNPPTDGSAWLSGGDSSLRVLRGGSWSDDDRYCRSAFRYRIAPGDRYNIIGFRVVVSARTR